ncbi:MAG: C-terminal processing protease CtpA/Prc [Planctomycetota bacterium]|jgi:C-terminal processing protease CtpA/Prc
MALLSRMTVLTLLLLASCSTTPAYTIPDPLPEALDWARPQSQDAGNFLGLKTRENDGGSLDALFFEPGVRVVRVIENSPALTAGIEVGDVLLELDGSEVNDPAALEVLVQRSAAGVEVQAKVRREDTVFELPLTIRSKGSSSNSEAKVLFYRDPARSQAGWADGGRGAVLASADEESPFPEAGVMVGSLVTRLDDRDVLSGRDLIRRMQVLPAGTEIKVEFETPQGESRSASVDLLSEESIITGMQFPIVFHYTDDMVRDSTEFVLIDLYVISLFRYTRTGSETEYKFLRWIQFSSGSGELSE